MRSKLDASTRLAATASRTARQQLYRIGRLACVLAGIGALLLVPRPASAGWFELTETSSTCTVKVSASGNSEVFVEGTGPYSATTTSQAVNDVASVYGDAYASTDGDLGYATTAASPGSSMEITWSFEWHPDYVGEQPPASGRVWGGTSYAADLELYAVTASSLARGDALATASRGNPNIGSSISIGGPMIDPTPVNLGSGTNWWDYAVSLAGGNGSASLTLGGGWLAGLTGSGSAASHVSVGGIFDLVTAEP